MESRRKGRWGCTLILLHILHTRIENLNLCWLVYTVHEASIGTPSHTTKYLKKKLGQLPALQLFSVA